MGEGKEDELIMQTLDEISSIEKDILDMKQAWRSGDNDTLERIAMVDIKKEFPDTHKTLFSNRNNAWAPKIETMLKNKSVELVLLGALHLVGDDGLINQLKRRGYSVENIAN
ncbi:MAG: hypothetical protein ACI9Y1_000857 [Lentisphaeria bacterium]|jgi:uncharacterized protein YbaP (TraB family)